MDKKISLEAKKAFEEFKVEMAEELDIRDTHLYDIRSNLSTTDAVKEPLLKVEKKSRNSPNNSFHDFLGKGF